MRIGWLVHQCDVKIASVRYRCLYPAWELQKAGLETVVFDDIGQAMAQVSKLDCLILSKVRVPAVVDLVRKAQKLDVKLIVDLCDDITVKGYDHNREWQNQALIREVAAAASAIVTTGPALAERLRQIVPQDVPVVIIPDQAERLEDIAAAISMASEFHTLEAQGGIAQLLGRGAKKLRGSSKVLGMALTMMLQDPKCFWKRVLRHVDSRVTAWRERAPMSLRGTKSAAVKRKRVIWFGNHGANYSNFGMASLLKIARHLSEINKRVPIELMVVSNNRERFDRYIAPLPFPTTYKVWDITGCYRLIESSDVFVMPNFSDDFSTAKSANRVTLSLLLGTPVVASYIPSLEPLKDVIVTDDWIGGLERYLLDTEAAKNDVARAKVILEEQYSGQVVGQLWKKVIEKSEISHRSSETNYLFLIDLLQDYQVLAPVIQKLVGHTGPEKIAVLMNERVAEANPWPMIALGELEIVPIQYKKADILLGEIPLFLGSFQAFVTAAETNLGPHRVAHQLVKAAKELDVVTYTLQHGFECPGITYFDDVYDEKVEIASDHILIWGRVEDLPINLSKATRRKCVSVGRPTSFKVKQETSLLANSKTIAIFENLHWHRYDDAYRAGFLDLLKALADYSERGGCGHIVVKPHPAGQWLTKIAGGENSLPKNITILGGDNNGLVTAEELIDAAVAVITTPSTVALDAAQKGVPVAIFAHKLALSDLSPLELVRTAEEGVEFVEGILRDPASYLESGQNFVSRVLAFDNGAEKVVGMLLNAGINRQA